MAQTKQPFNHTMFRRHDRYTRNNLINETFKKKSILHPYRGELTFNIVSLWAIWSIIFTYFGVNYYLSGLHSYAAGDPMPVPAWIYITAAGMLVLSLAAYFRNNVSKKQKINIGKSLKI